MHTSPGTATMPVPARVGRILLLKRVGIAVLGLAAAWPVVVAVLWLLTARPAPVVNVRWSAGTDTAERTGAERELSLWLHQRRGPETASYLLADSEPENVRRIVAHPRIEDTAFIDRNAFALDHPPQAILWLGDERPVFGRADLLYLSGFICLMGTVVLLAGTPHQAVWAARVLVFAAGVALSLFSGRYGFRPLEQSTVFDAGWRLLSGQLPGRDFFMSAGLLPALMQVPFFKVLGVTWFAYCLHAAVINGLFGLIAFDLLRELGGTLLVSTTAALLTGVYFYTPAGVPQPEHHAVFFSLCMIYAAIRAFPLVGDPRRERAWQIATPFLGLCALLSKPIPSLLVILVVTTWVVARSFRRDHKPLVIMGGTALAIAATVVVIAFVSGAHGELIFYGVTLPWEAFSARVHQLQQTGGLSARHAAVADSVCAGKACGLWPLSLVHLAGLAIGTMWVWARPFRVERIHATGTWILAELLVGLTLLSVYFGRNEAPTNLAFQPVALGLALVALVVATRVVKAPDRRAVVRAAICVPWLWVMAVDAARFNDEVNLARMIGADRWASDVRMKEVPWPLDFMQLNESLVQSDVADVLGALQRRDGNFLLMGESSILYGASGRPSVSPVLGFDTERAAPRPGTPAFSRLETGLLANMAAHDVRFLVVEDQARESCPGCVWGRFGLETFSSVRDQANGCPASRYGRFSILELCH